MKTAISIPDILLMLLRNMLKQKRFLVATYMLGQSNYFFNNIQQTTSLQS